MILRKIAGVALILTAVLTAIASTIGRSDRLGEAQRAWMELLARGPGIDHRGRYLGSDACVACHPREHATWAASYHRTMTQRATPAAVLAPFDGRALVGVDGESRVMRRGDAFWVSMVDPEWKLAEAERGGAPTGGPVVERQVVLTTGSHHLQVYWVASTSGDRLHAFPFSYLIAEDRWVANEGTLLRPPGGDAVYTWNRVCIQCHAVAGRPGVEDDRFATDVVELGIACEACHGPGAAHVQRHQEPIERYGQHLAGGADPTIVNPARLDHRGSSEVCGLCHSASVFADEGAWLRHGLSFEPGGDLADEHRLVRHPLRSDPSTESGRREAAWVEARLEEDPGFVDGRLWGDGVIRIVGRELSGLRESGCYQRGEISCLSCHRLHGSDPDDQLAPGMRGDQACLQCHPKDAAAIVSHTRHPLESEGSRCLHCHMPNTTYGLLKATRSHEIDSPDVSASVSGGRPNACNLCHLDRTLAWAAEHLERGYGIATPPLDDDDREVAASIVWALRGDASQRALIAWHYGWAPALEASGSAWIAPYLGVLAADPYDAVRVIAGRSLGGLPGFADFDYDPRVDPETLAGAPERIRQRWRAQGSARPAPALLIDARGSVDDARIAELLARRDTRPIEVRE